MARKADPDLEERILKGARALWKKGAGKALTMRAVASAARSNTPAVYRRFRTREDILRALLQQTRQEIFLLLASSHSVEEACEQYLDYAVEHPHDYELYFQHEYELLFAARQVQAESLQALIRKKRPSVDLMTRKLADEIGGSAGDHMHLTLAIFALLHGTAMLVIAKTVQPEHAPEMRTACRTAIATLMRCAARPSD
jgi:AcrR family transcriptional regulator